MRSTTENPNGESDKPSVPPQNGAKRSRCKTEKRYLGVRVRMPVRDLLRNIRIAKGMDPKDIQRISGKASKGDKKRVKTSADRKNSQKKRNTMAQEELSIIVEVLEEDLKTSTSMNQTNNRASPSSPEHNVLPKEFFPQTYLCEFNQKTEMAPSPGPYSPPVPSPESISSFPCAEYRKSFAVLADNFGGYSSDDSEDFRASPQMYVADSPSSVDYNFAPYHNSCQSSPEPSSDYGALDYGEGSVASPGFHGSCHQGSCQQEEWANDYFFWNQLEREGNLLKRISNRELLMPDRTGKMLIHRLVEEGKRAPVYIVAKRMAAMMQLNAKDQEGKTALHLAAQRNHHVMVGDLISLGANVSERDHCGKTCLHLSAESGYVRVLEVIKNAMRDGIHVDLEVKDANGLSVLQSVAVALSSTVREVELSGTQGPGRLHALRKEQMMETLECLLQMESNMHSVVHLGLRHHTNVESHLCEHAVVLPPKQNVEMCMT